MSDGEASYQPVPVIDAVAFDCADRIRLGEFWQSLLGGELRDHHGVTELHGGRVRLDFAEVPEGKQVNKNRVHLDLHIPHEAREQAVANALSLGASRADDIYDGDDWQCMRDPEGNEFCFVWGAA